MATGTTRHVDFEDKFDYSWPKDLQGLQKAARGAWEAFAELDGALAVTHALGTYSTTNEHGEAAQLAGQAYQLLKAIRAAGDKRLAEWEAMQAENARKWWDGEKWVILDHEPTPDGLLRDEPAERNPEADLAEMRSEYRYEDDERYQPSDAEIEAQAERAQEERIAQAERDYRRAVLAED